ncbi:hypothetical protein AB1K42_27575 [Roseibium algicola]|uniref:hypothetical protein n=1 Tax=Roseibium algicola TaxID=2857014 RepID=UPI00345AFFD9
MAETNFYTWGGWSFVGVVAAISVPIILALSAYYYNAIKAQLDDDQDRVRIRDELEDQTAAFQRYQSAISDFTLRADWWFGKPWSLRAFDRCLQIALVYPIALLLLAWALGMQGTIGFIRFLPDRPIGPRLFTVAILITISVGLFIYSKYDLPQRFTSWVIGRLFSRSFVKQRNFSWPYQFVVMMANMFAILVPGLIAITGALILTLADAVAFHNIGAGAAAGAGAGAVAVAVFCAFAYILAHRGIDDSASAPILTFSGLIVALIAVAGPISVTVVVAIVVFLVLLPLANGALDMISWGITRTLLSMIVHDSDRARGFALLIGALALDIAVAIACLVGLVALIALLLEASNLLIALFDIPEFDWKSQIDLAQAAPFNEGIFVTGMLATTLIPTVIHLTLGIGHAMTIWAPPAHGTRALIHDRMPTSAKQVVAREMLYRKLWMIPAFGVVCLIGWGLFTAFSFWIEPFGLFLKQVAFASSEFIAKP